MRFYLYGNETFPTPMADRCARGGEGIDRWRVDPHPHWEPRVGSAVRAVNCFWWHVAFGPVTTSDGRVVHPRIERDVPVAIRLDVDAGPVWLVAGHPLCPGDDGAAVIGDEVVVVFTSERMAAFGFPPGPFIGT
ncbi:hypothetical protein [Kineococcus xinjiangensis]|nr:hypothetical protein [Kineococcus xinjiangensis]